MENKYRITFSPNGLEPFTWLVHTFGAAMRLANTLADFDLGRNIPDQNHPMITKYKRYRQKHSINHPDLISYSTGSVDEQDDNGVWWVISEGLNEREFEVGEMSAFDNHIEDLIEEDNGLGDNDPDLYKDVIDQMYDDALTDYNYFNDIDPDTHLID